MRLKWLTGANAGTVEEIEDERAQLLIDKARARRLDPEELVALEAQEAEQAEIAQARKAEEAKAKATKKRKRKRK